MSLAGTTGTAPVAPATPSGSTTNSGVLGTGISGSSLLGAGALAGGAGYLLSQGPAPLPSEYSELLGNVPQLQNTATALEGEGQSLLPGAQALTQQGTAELSMANAGTLTPAQQSQLQQYKTDLANKSNQMFYSMGRNPNEDTAAITEQADNDAKVNAMAQQDIQTTIQLGLGELSAGGQQESSALGFTNAGLGFTSAANNALIAAGQAQVQANQSYSNSLTSVFTAIGTVLGGAAGFAAGGPAGAAAGAAVGGAVGKAV
jgi:hypothetical protein